MCSRARQEELDKRDTNWNTESPICFFEERRSVRLLQPRKMTNNLSAGKQRASFSGGEDDKQMLNKMMRTHGRVFGCVCEADMGEGKKVKKGRGGVIGRLCSDVRSSPCPWGPSSRRRIHDGSSRWRKARSSDRHTALHTPSLSLHGKWKERILKVWHTFTLIKSDNTTTLEPLSHAIGACKHWLIRNSSKKGYTRGVRDHKVICLNVQTDMKHCLRSRGAPERASYPQTAPALQLKIAAVLDASQVAV